LCRGTLPGLSSQGDPLGRTLAPVVRKIVHHRLKKRFGPVQIAPLVGLAPSTVRVLVRCRLNRLSWLDRATGTPIRYEYAAPGQLELVDVEKLGNIPARGGWRIQGYRVVSLMFRCERRQTSADRSTQQPRVSLPGCCQPRLRNWAMSTWL
jgi:hypothetical protein